MTITPPVMFVGAIVVGLAVVLSFWISPVIAIPLLVVGLGIVALLGLGRAREETGSVQQMRDQADSSDHFTERDRETLVEP